MPFLINHKFQLKLLFEYIFELIEMTNRNKSLLI